MKLKVLIYICLLFYGCSSRAQDQGVVIVHTYLFGGDSEQSPFSSSLKISVKILYKGKLSIQEVPILNFTQDSSGTQRVVRIKHFSFLDTDRNLCFNYKNFSDTAKYFSKYFDVDSVKVDGGWNFLSKRKFEYLTSETLVDTIIGNTAFKRMKLVKQFNKNEVYLILYVSCSANKTNIKLFKSISDSIGCPVVRDDTFIKGNISMTREIEFISEHLSQDELKIFDSWERNAKEKPNER